MSVKAFRAGSSCYAYSAWSNRIARIGARLYERLADTAPVETRSAAGREFGLLPDDDLVLEVFPDDMLDAALMDLQDSGPHHLVLTLTDACNFRCRYCTFSGAYPYSRAHGRAVMPEATAVEAVRWYFGLHRREYSIGFYGGEPLLCRRLIAATVSAARQRVPAGARLRFSLTSNGALLDAATMDFLAEQEIDLFVSVDGPAAVHDRYRLTRRGQPTFARVWQRLERLRSRHPDYFDRHVNLSLTLVPPDPTAAVDAFLNGPDALFAGKVPSLGFLNGAPSTVGRSLGLDEGEMGIDLSAVRRRYLERLVAGEEPDGFSRACTEGSMSRIHGRPMTEQTILRTQAGQCLPGKRCHVSTDGRLHMCEHGDEQRPIGRVGCGFDLARIAALVREYRQFVQSRCQGCWAVRFCHKCIPQFAAANRLDEGLFAGQCAAIQGGLARDLVEYCWARSRNERCFDRLDSRTSDAGVPLSQQLEE